MMRTAALAARALPVVLMTMALLCAFASIPIRTFAQAPQGAGAEHPPATQSPASQSPASQSNGSQPAQAPQAQAAQPQPAQTQTPEAPSTPAKPSKTKAKPKTSPRAAPSPAHETLAELAWLAGRWQGNWGPRTAQEIWLPPQSGVMVGVFQLTEDTKTLVIELYSIMATPEGIELRVRHFTPFLTPWEKSAPSLLKLMTYDSKSFLFVNQDNGQPKHWVMKRTDPNTYLARFEIVAGTDQMQSAEIVYHRQGIPAPASH
jgi:Domain of unknown function (DUF6265)